MEESDPGFGILSGLPQFVLPNIEEFIKNYPIEKFSGLTTREKRSSCPGGTGKFGFNTYNLLTFLLMSFNHVSR